MLTTAKLNYLRIAPRKVRLVADLIRGKSVQEAKNILNWTIRRTALPLRKLLESAAVSSREQFQLQEADLYIAKLTVDEGPKLKRWMPRARGSAYEIQKKTSHITLVLAPIKSIKPKKIKKTKKDEKLGEVKKPKSKKFKFTPTKEIYKPKAATGLKRVFRRKAF